MRSDRRKKPDLYSYRYMTNAEASNLKAGDSPFCVDDQGKIASVKITSVQRWRTRSDVVVKWKFGLRQFGFMNCGPDDPPCNFFITEVRNVAEAV
jgi:hypothetical protein